MSDLHLHLHLHLHTTPAPLQVVTSLLSYEGGSGYGEHRDCRDDTAGQHDSNDRMITFLIYLNDVEKGGTTRFPAAARGSNNGSGGSSDRGGSSGSGGSGGSSGGDDNVAGISVLPKQGSALLWFNLDLDPSHLHPTTGHPQCRADTLHEALPVLVGAKRVFQRWYHWRPGPIKAAPGLHTICDPSLPEKGGAEREGGPSLSCREYLEAPVAPMGGRRRGHPP